jgi:signal transduction histidine kinase
MTSFYESLKRFFKNFFSLEIEYKRKILFGILIAILPIEAAFILIGWSIQSPLTWGMHSTILVCSVLGIILLFSKPSKVIFRRYYLILLAISLVALIVTNVQDFSGMRLLQFTPWMMVVAVLGVFLIGRGYGILWAGAYLTIVGVPFLLAQPAELTINQIYELKVQMIIVIVAITSLMIIFEWLAGNSQRELEFQRKQAEQASKAKSDFLAQMSHELRTPMNHIIGFTELTLDDRTGLLDDQKAEYLQDVLVSSRHLLELINDMLDLSKIEAGKVELEWGTIDLTELVKSSVSVVDDKLELKKIKVITDVGEVPPEIQGDERRIKQILYNLLSNAVKFTPRSGTIRINGKVSEDHSMAVISITDSGIGIREENLQKIFLPFVQERESGSLQKQGTGLGLSLSRHLVELHGGSIWAESSGLDCGSVFYFTIPIKKQ